MRLFHGSDKEITKPIYGYGRVDCDYGSGFYMCADKNAAKMWASDNDNGGYINEYSINIKSLNVLFLNNLTNEDILKWIALLCFNRIDEQTRNNNKDEIDFLVKNYLPSLEDYDLVIGYRADDSYYQYTRAFLSNELPIELLKEAMELGKLGLQYVLISKKAFDSITFINSEKVNKSNEYKLLEEKANQEYDEIIRKRKINDTYLRDIIREVSKH